MIRQGVTYGDETYCMHAADSLELTYTLRMRIFYPLKRNMDRHEDSSHHYTADQRSVLKPWKIVSRSHSYNYVHECTMYNYISGYDTSKAEGQTHHP